MQSIPAFSGITPFQGKRSLERPQPLATRFGMALSETQKETVDRYDHSSTHRLLVKRIHDALTEASERQSAPLDTIRTLCQIWINNSTLVGKHPELIEQEIAKIAEGYSHTRHVVLAIQDISKEFGTDEVPDAIFNPLHKRLEHLDQQEEQALSAQLNKSAE